MLGRLGLGPSTKYSPNLSLSFVLATTSEHGTDLGNGTVQRLGKKFCLRAAFEFRLFCVYLHSVLEVATIFVKLGEKIRNNLRYFQKCSLSGREVGGFSPKQLGFFCAAQDTTNVLQSAYKPSAESEGFRWLYGSFARRELTPLSGVPNTKALPQIWVQFCFGATILIFYPAKAAAHVGGVRTGICQCP